MKFFFDRNVSKHLARMLHGIDREHSIVHQDDDNRFEDTSTDVHIINTLASETPKPVFLTQDIGQKKDPDERKALADSGMSIVFWRKLSQASHFDQAIRVLAIWPAIVDYCDRCKVPTAFEVPSGKIPKDLPRKLDDLGPTQELFR